MLRMFLENSGTEVWSESEVLLILKCLTPLRLLTAQVELDSVSERLQYLMDHIAERNQVWFIYLRKVRPEVENYNCFWQFFEGSLT